MTARHLELLVEEPSMEAFLRELLPRMIPGEASFAIHAFAGKHDLLAKLEPRLRGYANWLPPEYRLMVVVDRDEDDCLLLKQRLENAARSANLLTRSRTGTPQWQLVNRVAVEELEAWYFGDWAAVREAYRGVPDVSKRAAFHDPDDISGGTWEAFERELQRYGHFQGGLTKVAAARELGRRLDPQRCRSHSFTVFRMAVEEAFS